MNNTDAAGQRSSVVQWVKRSSGATRRTSDGSAMEFSSETSGSSSKGRRLSQLFGSGKKLLNRTMAPVVATTGPSASKKKVGFSVGARSQKAPAEPRQSVEEVRSRGRGDVRATTLAVGIAQEIRQKAAGVEEDLTMRMREIKDALGADVRLEGLDQKFKSIDSLERKIALVVRRWQMNAISEGRKAMELSSDQQLHNELRSSVDQQIVDALRYTFILPQHKYSILVTKARELLESGDACITAAATASADGSGSTAAAPGASTSGNGSPRSRFGWARVRFRRGSVATKPPALRPSSRRLTSPAASQKGSGVASQQPKSRQPSGKCTRLRCVKQNNYWYDPCTAPDGEETWMSYQGINDAYQLQTGLQTRFEVQFHTEASFQHKTSTHVHFESLRDMIDHAKRLECLHALVQSAKQVPLPEGVLALPKLARFPPLKSEVRFFAEYIHQKLLPLATAIAKAVEQLLTKAGVRFVTPVEPLLMTTEDIEKKLEAATQEQMDDDALKRTKQTEGAAVAPSVRASFTSSWKARSARQQSESHRVRSEKLAADKHRSVLPLPKAVANLFEALTVSVVLGDGGNESEAQYAEEAKKVLRFIYRDASVYEARTVGGGDGGASKVDGQICTPQLLRWREFRERPAKPQPQLSAADLRKQDNLELFPHLYPRLTKKLREAKDQQSRRPLKAHRMLGIARNVRCECEPHDFGDKPSSSNRRIGAYHFIKVGTAYWIPDLVHRNGWEAVEPVEPPADESISSRALSVFSRRDSASRTAGQPRQPSPSPLMRATSSFLHASSRRDTVASQQAATSASAPAPLTKPTDLPGIWLRLIFDARALVAESAGSLPVPPSLEEAGVKRKEVPFALCLHTAKSAEAVKECAKIERTLTVATPAAAVRPNDIQVQAEAISATLKEGVYEAANPPADEETAQAASTISSKLSTSHSALASASQAPEPVGNDELEDKQDKTNEAIRNMLLAINGVPRPAGDLTKLAVHAFFEPVDRDDAEGIGCIGCLGLRPQPRLASSQAETYRSPTGASADSRATEHLREQQEVNQSAKWQEMRRNSARSSRSASSSRRQSGDALRSCVQPCCASAEAEGDEVLLSNQQVANLQMQPRSTASSSQRSAADDASPGAVREAAQTFEPDAAISI